MSDQTEKGVRDSKKWSEKRNYPEEVCGRRRVKGEQRDTASAAMPVYSVTA